MDEQRLAAYYQLIQALLECPNGANDILNAHRELVDADFVQVMEAVAANMAAEDESNAGWLQNLAALLANYVSNTATPEEYLSFLMEVLQATSDSGGNPEFVYPILQQNLDKLNLIFGQILQGWARSTFTQVTSEQAASIAGVICEFGNFIQQFPLGQRAWNLEISIACYTAALQVYKREHYPKQWAAAQICLGTAYSDRIAGVSAQNIEEAIARYTAALEFSKRKDYPEQWATAQICLGVAYSHRIAGVSAQNIEEAIARYTAALEVYKRKDYPEYWASTQNNLGTAYSYRIAGVRAENIEEAISCYTAALEVYKRKDYPEYWAMTQNNLGEAYTNRIAGVRAANIEEAIAYYTAALEVRTRENYPEDWAMTQNNLAAAYSDRIEGLRAANIEEAIARYTAALEVYKRKDYPEQWATTQNNLAIAYSDRIEGLRAENIEEAIARYTAALEVHTRKYYPKQWARTQNNLGNAYRNRIEGVRAENIEEAIACYREALEVYKRENYPEDWAMTQNNLGNAYSDRIEGVRAANIEEAISCYREALIVYKRKDYPEDWAMTQNNLGTAYSDRIEGVRAANIEEAISCYREALIVYKRKDYPEQWAMTQNNLGNAYSNRIEGVRGANIEEAIACYREALKVRKRENYPEKWATTQNNLGTAYSDRIEGVRAANIELAIACYREALIVRTPTAFPLDCLQSGRNLGDTAFTAGFWDIAIEGFEKAIQAVEKSRSWATSDNIRQQMIAESIGVYEKAIQAAVNNNQLEKAIEYCDRTRAQRLVDLMHSNDLYAKGEIPPAAKEYLQQVQKYLDEFKAKQQLIDAEVEQLRNPSEGNKGLASVGSQSRSRADTSAYTKKIQELEGEKQQIWENIRRLDPVLAGQVQVVPMQFGAMQQLIDNSQTAILCFYTTDDDTHIFVIYKDKAPQIHTCHGEGWGSFQKWIREGWLSPYLGDKKAWKHGMGEFLSQLSRRLKVDELIGNCLEGIQELIVIPHLYLHQIPLAALPIDPPQPPLRRGGQENPRFLGDKFLIRYIPSCRILEYCHQRPTIESPKYGIVENATDDLYFTPFECEQIAEIVTESERLKGSQQATVATYRKLAQNVNVIHSSHHAVSRLDNPLESRLFLGDGSITLGELMTPGWRLPQLSDVFMSCCETNLASTEITDNLLSLGTGFLCAGARSVVSTLWAVDDFATSLFSIFYYQYRREGLSRPEALWRAQVRLRRISGAELKGLYQPQIDPLLERIIKDLASKLAVVQKDKKELRLRHKSYNKGTDEFKKLDRELTTIVKQENQIQDRKKGYESWQENLYTMSNPFADLSYWSGFICQGLH
ncbi:CHAT domain-containing tetratricopeptide repeat protein [Microcoleus sp. CAWBG640]|uniref:CHAT domain-containing protein n=1 Tax=Microcoleus sp. CAWBG640 TaxID=2841653 RepID=UPI00312BBF8C